MADNRRTNDDENVKIPSHLERWPGLYMRQGDTIVEALPEDIDVAKRYPTATNKGAVVGGRRITIMCAKSSYHIGEEIRVIHVLEVIEPGQEIFIMGPKSVSGEYVDGRAMTADISSEEQGYDGRVIASPGVDYNYDITTYTFNTPGRHEIYWQMGELRSNTLELDIVSLSVDRER
jgi:hypothetical protein